MYPTVIRSANQHNTFQNLYDNQNKFELENKQKCGRIQNARHSCQFFRKSVELNSCKK